MINFEKVSEKTFNLLKGFGYKIKMFSNDGDEEINPTKATRFFVTEPNLMITVDQENKEVKLNKNSNISLEEVEKLIKQLKNLAHGYMLNFDLRNFGKEIKPRDYVYQVKKMQDKDLSDVMEAKMSPIEGTKKTSRQRFGDTTVVFKHNKAVDESKRGARSRNITDIFIEQNKERFRFKENNLLGARALANHMSKGGHMYDSVGKHIVEQTGILVKLKENYKTLNKNKELSESYSDVKMMTKTNIKHVQESLRKFVGVTTYESCCDAVNDDDFDIEYNVVNGLIKPKSQRDLEEMTNLLDNRSFSRYIKETLLSNVIIEKFEFSDTLVEFESPNHQLSSQIKEFSQHVQNNDFVKSFMEDVSENIVTGDISEKQVSMVKNIISNATSINSVVENNQERVFENELKNFALKLLIS